MNHLSLAAEAIEIMTSEMAARLVSAWACRCAQRSACWRLGAASLSRPSVVGVGGQRGLGEAVPPWLAGVRAQVRQAEVATRRSLRSVPSMQLAATIHQSSG